MGWHAAPRAGGNKSCPTVYTSPPAMGMHLALKMDLLAQMDELLCPLHGLHTGIALLHQLGRPWWVTNSPPVLAQPQAPTWEPAALIAGALFKDTLGFLGGSGEPDGHCPAKLTSLRALKALVAMSSCSEPCAVRLRMFWRGDRCIEAGCDLHP